MGRNKIKIEKLSSKSSRKVTFSKRKNGLIKKAYELSVLCDTAVVVICFTPNDKLCFFSRPKGVADVLLEFLHKLDDVQKDEERKIIIRNKDRIISLLQNVKRQDEMEAKERTVEEANRKEEEGAYRLFPPENAYPYPYEDIKRQHARLMFLLRWFKKDRYNVPMTNSSEFDNYEERLMSSLRTVWDRKNFLQSYASLKVEQLQANSSTNTLVPLLEHLRISASHYNSNPQPPKMLQLQSQPHQQQSMLMQRNVVMLNMQQQQQTLEIPMQMQHEQAALDNKNKGKMIMINPNPKLTNRMQQQIEQETNYMQVQRELAPLNQNNNGNTTTHASHQRTVEEANQEQEWSNATALIQQHFYQMNLGNGNHQAVEEEQGAIESQPEMNQDAIQTHQPETEMRSSSQVNNVFGPPMISSDYSWNSDYSTSQLAEQHPFQSSVLDTMPSMYTTSDDIGNQANLDLDLDLPQVNLFYDFEGPSQDSCGLRNCTFARTKRT